MYINPINKQTPQVSSTHKRKKAGGDSTFAEEVETLLELDAVDITNPHKEKENQQGKGDLRSSLEREKKEDSDTPDDHLPQKKGDKSLNIRA